MKPEKLNKFIAQMKIELAEAVHDLQEFADKEWHEPTREYLGLEDE